MRSERPTGQSPVSTAVTDTRGSELHKRTIPLLRSSELQPWRQRLKDKKMTFCSKFTRRQKKQTCGFSGGQELARGSKAAFTSWFCSFLGWLASRRGQMLLQQQIKTQIKTVSRYLLQQLVSYLSDGGKQVTSSHPQKSIFITAPLV